MKNFFSKAIADTLYQVILVSGVNIKTINDESLLGSGNIVITGGSIDWGEIGGTLSAQTDLQAALDAKAAATHTHAASEITTGTLDDLRLSANIARSSYLFSPRVREAIWTAASSSQAVSGSGSTSVADHAVNVQTNATAGSRAVRFWPTGLGSSWLNQANANSSMLTGWSRIRLSFAMDRVATTANGQWWFKFGIGASNAGNLATRGFQVRLDNSNLFFGSFSDTGPLVQSSSVAYATGGNNVFLFDWENGSSGRCFHNGTLVHTFSSSEIFTTFLTSLQIASEVQNNADAANMRVIISSVRMIVE